MKQKPKFDAWTARALASWWRPTTQIGSPAKQSWYAENICMHVMYVLTYMCLVCWRTHATRTHTNCEPCSQRKPFKGSRDQKEKARVITCFLCVCAQGQKITCHGNFWCLIELARSICTTMVHCCNSCIYICICVHTCVHVCMCLFMCVCVSYACMYEYLCACLHMSVYVWVSIHV